MVGIVLNSTVVQWCRMPVCTTNSKELEYKRGVGVPLRSINTIRDATWGHSSVW